MNEKLKKTLKHYIDLEHYANGVAEDIEELLDELYKKCNETILANDYLKTKNDYNAVHSVMTNYYDEFEDELTERLENEAEIIKENEREFLSGLYGAALTVGTVALSKVLFMPFDGRDTVKSFAERTVKNINRTYDNALRSGYMFGKKSSEVKEEAERQLKHITKGVNNGIITAVPSFAKTTDRIIFLQNNAEVVWVATLDGRTCINCASLSGLKFKSIAEAPGIQHCLCRCILVKASEIDEPVPEFEEFVKSLSEEEQEEVLGTNRFSLWKEYGIKLDKFLNDGRIIPLKDLDIDLLKKESKLSNEAVNIYKNNSHAKYLRNKLFESLKPKFGTYQNDSTGIKAHLNGRSLKKLGSDKAIEKSKSNGFTIAQHFEVAENIADLYKKSILVESRPDKNGSAQLLSIKRFDVPFELSDGKKTKVHITVKESVDSGHKIYSVELLPE